jgi:broad specificity phosphatase PhoE
MGAWEGAIRAATYTASTLAAVAADPLHWAPPGGESQAAVEARMAAYIASAVLPSLQPGGPPAVVVGHGLAIKCFLRRVLASDAAAFAARNIRLDNASVTEVGLCGAAVPAAGGAAWPGWGGLPRDAWHVLRVNDAAHCEGLAACGEGSSDERLGA